MNKYFIHVLCAIQCIFFGALLYLNYNQLDIRKDINKLNDKINQLSVDLSSQVFELRSEIKDTNISLQALEIGYCCMNSKGICISDEAVTLENYNCKLEFFLK